MKPFTLSCVLLLCAVAVLHLVRLLAGWPVSINGIAVPVWLSAVFGSVAVLLAVMLWREARR